MDPEKVLSSEMFTKVYGDDPDTLNYQKERIKKAFDGYAAHFGVAGDVHVFSAAGRSEIGGNHTDHQRGQVLAASLNIDSLAIAATVPGSVATVYSEGYETYTIDLSDLDKKPAESGSTAALIRGVAAGFAKKGFSVGGFNAYVTSDVLGGSGLSSSASFESLIGAILSGLFNDDKISTVDIAKIGQFAENEYLDKPCGLMDQMACSVGGFVHIDFGGSAGADTLFDDSYPKMERIEFDPEDYGYSLVITDTKASHADLTHEYAAIPAEMKSVAAYFNKDVLSEVSEDDFIKEIGNIRKQTGDRAIVRALHFFEENKRVIAEAASLEKKDFAAFLEHFSASARSSFEYLQNIHPTGDANEQSMSIALGVSDVFLSPDSKGYARVHGGGFAGTIQTFVKSECADDYMKAMDALLGEGSSKKYRIRKYGCVRII